MTGKTRAPAPTTASVVVCTYTTARWSRLVDSLDSVRRQTCPPREVLVVVDHCPEVLARADELGPGVRVLENLHAPGLSGARNSGVEAALGEVVVFLDDDAVAEATWLERLLAPYEDPRVVGVGGGVVADWETARPSWFPTEFDWVVGCSYTGLPVAPAEIRNPIGANMSFRRAAILTAGGFSSRVGRVGSRPTGCEETELSLRIARREPGRRILLAPDAVVHHHVPLERGRWRYFRRRCWAEGLSKATVSRLAASTAPLTSERSYTVRTLPRGALRGLRDAVDQRSLAGAARSLAITGGLLCTVAGYTTGLVLGRGLIQAPSVGGTA